MNKILVDSVGVLLEHINALPNNFLYRGQASAEWRLESSLERMLGDKWTFDRAKKFEDFSLKQFCSKFHLYDRENAKPESKLAWLSVMQHHGVPTRLLDFTESPYVAIYFALEAYNPRGGCDMALYAIDYAGVLDQSIVHIMSKDAAFCETRCSIFDRQDEIFERVVDQSAYDIAWVAEPKILNARLDRQAGSFILSGNGGGRIEDVLASPLYVNCEMKKFVIPYYLYEGLFTLLRKMNITSRSLYGDLDGLARAIRMEIQAYAD